MQTKENIVNAMIQVFSNKGYIASMSDISDIVGIKVPSIYSHFKSKDEILYLAVEKELSNHYQFFVDSYTQLYYEPTEIILKGIYDRTLEYYSDMKKLRFIHYIDIIPNTKLLNACQKLQGNYMQKILDGVQEIFKQGQANKELKPDQNQGYHYLYVTMLQGLLRGRLMFEKAVEERLECEQILWKTFWSGIKADNR